ncbi:hypothetical protein ACFVVU_26815 [Kitasatospora sp. NPDC057965]|uniref:hypothetical protein n=1 Tax=Kitasatospora sp. NPDC057965 TaxID=3346291 RepID=UPI0036D86464
MALTAVGVGQGGLVIDGPLTVFLTSAAIGAAGELTAWGSAGARRLFADVAEFRRLRRQSGLLPGAEDWPVGEDEQRK